MDGTVLIADDDRSIRTVLSQALTRAGCRVHATSSLMTLMRWVEEGRGDLVICDVVMPDGNGLDRVPDIARLRPALPVIIISAQNTIVTAIKAAQAEAFDYLPKPFDLPELLAKVKAALARDVASVSTPSPVAAPDGCVDHAQLPLLGRSAVMQALYRTVARVINTDLSVMITGQSGTGKTLIAHTVHNFSDRREAPFVTATPDDFTSRAAAQELAARAHGGSILIDEIADLPQVGQAHLLRMLDDFDDNTGGAGRKTSDELPRILSSSQKDLATLIAHNHFRSDLFYRLSGVVIAVPPLRARVEDISLLAQHFLGVDGDEMPAYRPCLLSDAAHTALRAYGWPGNVRQLKHVVQTLSLTGGEGDITAEDVAKVLEVHSAQSASESGAPEQADTLSFSVERHVQRYFDLHGADLPPPGLYRRILHEFERPLLEIALNATAGNQAKCAELLGINRNTLRKKLKEIGICVTKHRKMM